jgi:hypothetical protein
LDLVGKLERADFFRESVIRAVKSSVVNNPEQDSEEWEKAVIYGEYFLHEIELGSAEFQEKSSAY